MDTSRNGNVDNGKHGPSGNYTKESASTDVQWPYAMGEWDAPGRKIVTDDDTDTTEDDAQQHVYTGPTQYNPVSPSVGKRSAGQ